MNNRSVIRSDADLINETGITPADHDYSTSADYQKLRREILGQRGPRRVETDEEKQARLRRQHGWR